VYWRGGALLNSVSNPGYHLKMPFLTSVGQVQTTVQTDSVTNIPCGTSGGVLIHFDKVEVVNRLEASLVYETVKNYTVDYDKTWIFDKIHHEVNQFCSGHTLQEVYIDLFDTLDESLALALQRDCGVWAPGIEIIAVRVTKPRIPDRIRANYEAMEAEKTKLLIATETQKVAQKEAETERLRATIAADKVAKVSEIKMRQKIAEKEAEQKIATLEDKIRSSRLKANADAEFYAAVKEAEGNEQRLTPAFLEFAHLRALANNTKVYFGEKIPKVYLEKGNRGASP